MCPIVIDVWQSVNGYLKRSPEVTTRPRWLLLVAEMHIVLERTFVSMFDDTIGAWPECRADVKQVTRVNCFIMAYFF